MHVTKVRVKLVRATLAATATTTDKLTKTYQPPLWPSVLLTRPDRGHRTPIARWVGGNYRYLTYKVISPCAGR